MLAEPTPSPVCSRRASPGGDGRAKDIPRPSPIGATNDGRAKRSCDLATMPTSRRRSIARPPLHKLTGSASSADGRNGGTGSPGHMQGDSSFGPSGITCQTNDRSALCSEAEALIDRSSWKVTDSASLRTLPLYSPPLLEGATSVDVANTSPSAIAARISEACRRHGIAMDYDGKSATAEARTWDNIAFSVQLYRSQASSSEKGLNNVEQPDGVQDIRDGSIIVEIRQSKSGGCPVRFHRDYCRPLLLAATGKRDPWEHHSPAEQRRDGGDDDERALPFPPSITCAKRRRQASLLSTRDNGSIADVSSSPRSKNLSTACRKGTDTCTRDSTEARASLALERALDLVKKDRIDASRLGMESLLLLCDADSSGEAIALTTAQAVLLGTSLGPRFDHSLDEKTSSSLNLDVVREVHELVTALIQRKRLPDGFGGYEDDFDFVGDDWNEHLGPAVGEICNEKYRVTSGDTKVDDDREDEAQVRSTQEGRCCLHVSHHEHRRFPEHEHASFLRVSALKVVARSLQLIHDKGLADEILSSSFCHESTILALVYEVTRLSRGEAWAALDATFATRCLCILVRTSKEARKWALLHDARSVLKRAANVGRLTNAIFVQEAEVALSLLSADEV